MFWHDFQIPCVFSCTVCTLFARLHRAVKGPIPCPSAQSPRAEVQKVGGTATTPFKVGPFGAYLTGYDKNKADYLISGLTNRFFLESEGLTTPRTEVANPPISRHLAEQVGKKLHKEINAEHVKGPANQSLQGRTESGSGSMKSMPSA